MFTKAQSYKLLWNFAIPETLNASQQWVLSAMQSYGDQLITMLWRILGNEQDVCDAYQDTFLHLAHFENGLKPNNIKAYVFRSASNTAISILRRRMLEKKNLPKIVDAQNANANSSDLDSNALQQQLRDTITKLPDLLRDVVTLHDLGELPYAHVAKILNMTEGCARVYRHKAIQLLAVLMNKLDE
jgi:RNA polymerase sigma factor (sigma-70 family)